MKIITPFLKLVFCAGNLSDVMCVPPWRIATGRGELTVIGSIKSGAWPPKVEARCVNQILSGKLISRAIGYSAVWRWLGLAWLSLIGSRSDS